MGGKGSGYDGESVVVGYRYYLGQHQVLCQGPVDAITALEVGGRRAWTGTQGQGTLSVSADGLFGGDSREGGISGAIEIALGGATQSPSLYLARQVGGASQVVSAIEIRSTSAADTTQTLTLDAGTLDPDDGYDPVRAEIALDGDTWVAAGEWTAILWLSLDTECAGDVEVRIVGAEDPLATLTAGSTLETIAWSGEWVLGEMPAHRGVVSAIWQGVYVGLNPYLKDVRWRVRRQTPADGWYPETAAIGADRNPAHILHELLTDARWGLELPLAAIDDDAFRAAADTLLGEGLGLSLLWESGSVIDLEQTVLDHCDGRLYVSPSSGLWTFDLIRADYAVEDLPVADASSIVEVRSFERRGWDETVNEMVVSYIDGETGQERQVTAQNLANRQVQGAVVSAARSYPGASSAALAARLAERDLAVLSRPLARLSLVALRSAWDWAPGAAIRVAWSDYGLGDLVFRVAAIDYGTLDDGQIQVDLVEDAFGLASQVYLEPQPPLWEDPVAVAKACPHQTAIEAPYWDVARTLSAADLAALPDGTGFVLACGERPGSGHYDYRLWSDSGDGFSPGNSGPFTPTAVLARAVSGADTTIQLSGPVDLASATVGTWADVGGESVAILAVDLAHQTIEVARGVLDTTPVAHAAGTRIWCAASARCAESIERMEGEEIALKLTPRSGLGALPLASATALSITLADRAGRPYPPGRVRLNGEAWPATLTGDLTVTWAHRDRTQQTAYLVAQDETDIGPEEGVTYTLKIYRADTGVLLRTYAALTGTSQTYPASTRAADWAGPTPHLVRIELEAVRDELSSWQAQVRQCEMAG